jgi:hypothetical protein
LAVSWGAGANVPDFTLLDETNRAVVVERPDALKNRGSCEFFVAGFQACSGCGICRPRSLKHGKPRNRDKFASALDLEVGGC